MRIGHLGERESLSEGEDGSDRALTQQEYSRGVCEEEHATALSLEAFYVVGKAVATQQKCWRFPMKRAILMTPTFPKNLLPLKTSSILSQSPAITAEP